MEVRKKKEFEEARELRLQGMHIKPIAQIVGVHHDTVRKWVGDLPFRHGLTDLDVVERTGVCQICGPVGIRKNGPKWLCSTAARAKSRNNARRAAGRMYDFLLTQSCVDCDNKDPIVLEFDHVRGTKEHNVSNMVTRGNKWETILKEIEKCDVVCANCHKIRTAKRGQFFKYLQRA